MSSAHPHAWTTAIDKNSGRTYYFNTETHETCWTNPSATPLQTTSQTDLPPNLVVKARALTEKLKTCGDQAQRVEVESFSAGEIADFHFLQTGEARYMVQTVKSDYKPIEPFTIDVTRERPPPEPTRLETRLHALYREMEKLDRKSS